MFYDTFQTYKTSEVDEASISNPRQKLPLKPKGEEGGDVAEREAESLRTAVEAKMVMGPNKKHKAPVPPRGLRRKKRRG